MEILHEPLPGIKVIQPQVFSDDRGFFLETFQASKFKALGINTSFVQDNHSRSSQGVLRGLHFQKDHPQGKLVYVPQGEVFDVAVDIRPDSDTFGEWFGTILNDQNHQLLFIPPGFAHGFCVLSEKVEFIYKCTNFYTPNDEYGIIWNDPELNIKWPIDSPLLSDKDKHYPNFSEIRKMLTDFTAQETFVSA